MTTLWRCDVCLELIDPVEGDDHTTLTVTLEDDDGASSEHIDLCQDCRPPSVGKHMDWLTHAMEDV